MPFDDIVRYYDECQTDYEIVWHLNTHMCMHYGYWDDTTPNLRSSLSNMNTKLAAFAGIKSGDKVLDAGCGVGGSSIFLAKKFNCTTTGITLSEKQVACCRQNANKHNITLQCSFERQNYLKTTFPDDTFDIIWAIESVCYAPSKLDFLKEAFRILKPGGKLVVADFYETRENKAAEEIELLNKMSSSWSIQNFAVADDFWNQMHLSGFTNSKHTDVTHHVNKSINRLYYSFYPGVVITHIGELLRLRTPIQTANTWSAYYQYRAFKKGLWKYLFFCCEKP
jgi:tocopherol O-methyltransferase